MKRTFFVLLMLGFVIAALAGGTAFILRQKQLGDLEKIARQAEDKLNGQSYDTAISMLKKVQDQGGTDRSTYLLGKAYYSLGKYDEGLRYFNEVITKYPKSALSAESYLYLGKHFFNKENDPTQAQNHYLKILADHPKSPTKDFALVELARISLKNRDEVRAKKNLDLVMKTPNSPARSEAEFLIGDLNMKTLKSPDLAPGDETYTIKAGDTLSRISSRLKVPIDLLSGINDLDDPRALTIGRQIRVPRLNITIEINKSERTLIVYNNEEFLKKYRVGLPQNDSSLPKKKYAVKKKSKGSDYRDPSDNKVIKAGQSGNPYGSRFIELAQGTAIHGTDDNSKVGKLLSIGTVTMTNQDVEEVYALVQTNTPVTVIGQVNSEVSTGTAK